MVSRYFRSHQEVDMARAKWATLSVSIVILGSVVYGQSGRKPRVFVTDSNTWEMMGGFTANRNYAQGHVAGGARPQTAEIIKTLGERCPDFIVTINKDRADYILILEHEGGKSVVRKDNKFALFNKDGDAITSGSTRSLGNSVKDVCSTLRNDWQENRTDPVDKKTATGAVEGDSSNRQSGGGSVGSTLQDAFDQMASNAHIADKPQLQRNTRADQKADKSKQSTTEDRRSTASTSEQPPEASRRTGQETTTEFGNADSFLFAKGLADHLLRVTAEKANDVEAYNKLRKSGKLLEVHNHCRVRIISSAKDRDGSDVFEVTILPTRNTVWIESKFLK
jgi:hypothetical protein